MNLHKEKFLMCMNFKEMDGVFIRLQKDKITKDVRKKYEK